MTHIHIHRYVTTYEFIRASMTDYDMATRELVAGGLSSWAAQVSLHSNHVV